MTMKLLNPGPVSMTERVKKALEAGWAPPAARAKELNLK